MDPSISFLLRLLTVLVSSALVVKRGGLNDSAPSSTLIYSIRLMLSTSLLATALDNWQSLVMPFSTTLRAHTLDTLVLALHLAPLDVQEVGCRLHHLNPDKSHAGTAIRPTLECWFFQSDHLVVWGQHRFQVVVGDVQFQSIHCYAAELGFNAGNGTGDTIQDEGFTFSFAAVVIFTDVQGLDYLGAAGIRSLRADDFFKSIYVVVNDGTIRDGEH